jgi:hypothetical protein
MDTLIQSQSFPLQGVLLHAMGGLSAKIDIEYFGEKRNTGNPSAGSFNELKEERQSIKVWPEKQGK